MAVITLTNPSVMAKDPTRYPDNALAVTPSDTNTFSQPVTVTAFGAGNIAVTPANGGATVTVALLQGQTLPFRVTQVWATGTTATEIVATY